MLGRHVLPSCMGRCRTQLCAYRHRHHYYDDHEVYHIAYLYCISWLHIVIAYLCCISVLHMCLAYLYCIYVLHSRTAYLCCISVLHICIAYLYCTSVLHIFIAHVPRISGSKTYSKCNESESKTYSTPSRAAAPRGTPSLSECSAGPSQDRVWSVLVKALRSKKAHPRHIGGWAWSYAKLRTKEVSFWHMTYDTTTKDKSNQFGRPCLSGPCLTGPCLSVPVPVCTVSVWTLPLCTLSVPC